LGDHDFHGASDAAGEIHPAPSYAAAPVPEPQTYLMMLAGLGAAGLLALRRKVVG
jgi:hypothetical protein